MNVKKLIHRIRSKIFGKVMYPELEKAGGLANALDVTFLEINSSFRTFNDGNLDQFPLPYSIVKNENKYSQILIAAEEKLYIADFWKDGICLAHGGTSNITDLAKAIDFWLRQNVLTKVLAETYSFIQLNERAKAFDENKEVAYAWNYLQREVGLDLEDFVQVAVNDPVLNMLFPFTSLYTLCFSRCTGYPFDTAELPNVTSKKHIHFVPTQNGKEYPEIDNDSAGTKSGKIYVVTKNRDHYLGEGNADEALNIVRKNLPDNIQPARRGSLDD